MELVEGNRVLLQVGERVDAIVEAASVRIQHDFSQGISVAGTNVFSLVAALPRRLARVRSMLNVVQPSFSPPVWQFLDGTLQPGANVWESVIEPHPDQW
jgi:hypothetical protein